MNDTIETGNIGICESFCAWIDLLGYGSAFYSSNWDLQKDGALRNLYRIKKLEPITTSIYNPLTEALFSLNDGFIRNFDIPSNDVVMILGWFVDVLLKFKIMNERDVENGFCGARGVIAYGSRAQYRTVDTLGKGDLIQTSEERKVEYNKKHVIFTPYELQMNTAFSKAYIIESGGSKGGLKKNKLHITEEVLVKLAETINRIKSDEFGLEDNDYEENGPCVHEYSAEFNKEEKFFLVKARSGDIEWNCFKIEFDDAILYLNEPQALTTYLYTPCRVHDAIYSPYDEGDLEL